jgi:hypothetical protein
MNHSPIRDYVSPEGRLVREQDGVEVTDAGHVSDAAFAVSPRAGISVKFAVSTDLQGKHEKTVHELQIFPRNSTHIESGGRNDDSPPRTTPPQPAFSSSLQLEFRGRLRAPTRSR